MADIMMEALESGAVVSQMARRHGLRAGQMFDWLREARKAGAASVHGGDQAGGLPPGHGWAAKLVKDEMKAGPFSGVVYVFRAKRADRKRCGGGTLRYGRLRQAAQAGRGWVAQDRPRRDAADALELAALVERVDWSRALTPVRTPAPQDVALALWRDDSGHVGAPQSPADMVMARGPRLLAVAAAADRASDRVIDIEDKTSPSCAGALHKIGEDVAERLVRPATFRALVRNRDRDASTA